ncbi:chromosome segregation protein SMC [Rothia nasimurium]|uniref:chromosome segregation protein SMC n=1 Tax=Rothia nasimurium TaxID=85336 RepID=UPI003B9EE182
MYLKSLTVRGFKSFASATVFEFEPGLNVMVGPNGSGKSNVVDALAWVMGAQGAKALRGAAMKDVIFSGSGSRGALGRAKVELVIDNSDGTLPLPHAEIKLTRTMFSAGGSEYDVNGEPARLSDVQELLADTGVGRELYTLVGQGQVDRILHGTAADRRELIEQAAGLVKHRKRQSKTVGKLEDLKTNLDRLEDMAAELADQLEGRREQADAAQAAAEVAGRVRTLSADLLAVEALELTADLEGERAAGRQAREARVRAQEQGEAARTRLDLLVQQMETAREKLAAATGEATALQELAHRIESVALVAQERAKTVEGDQSIQDATSRRQQAQKALDAEKQACQAAQNQVDETAKAVLDTLEILTQKKMEAEAARKAAEEADQERSSHREQISELTQNLATARVALEKAGQEADRRDAEYQAFSQNKGDLAGEVARYQEEVASLTVEHQQAQAREDEARVARQKAGQESEKTRNQAHQAELKVQSCAARYSALESAWAHDGQVLGDDAESRQAAVDAGAEELISLLEIEEGWEGAVGALLGPALKALVGQGLGEGSEKVSYLVGRPAPETSSDKVAKTHPLLEADSCWSLENIIQGPRELINVLTLLYPLTFFCEDQATGRKLLAALPEARVITRGGTVLTSYSQLHMSGAAKTAELHLQVQEAGQDLHDAEDQARLAQQAYQEAHAAYTQAQDTEKSAARLVGTLSANLATATASLAALEGRASGSAQELTRLSEAKERAAQAQDAAQTQATEAAQALEALRNSAPTQDVATLHREAQKASEAEKQAAEAHRVAEASHRFAQEKAETAQARLTQATEMLATFTQSEDQAIKSHQENQQKQEAAQKIAGKAQVLAQAVAQLQTQAQATQQTTQQQVDSLAARISDAREEATGAQTSLAAALTLYAESATRLARVESRWEALQTRAVEEFQQELTDLLSSRSPRPETKSTLEAALVAAEADLARLGITNPLALEEYRALEERHTYLRQQIADIKASRSDVQAVMKEISDHIESSFDSALADVQDHFQQIFATLFPGGEGKLVLADPNDRDSSGIDIQVKPAGKKVSRLSLLSGGERTLASLALLLAVFMARPAPFYVLDEVEAALDDRNLGRLLDVLGKLREKSQLLMITHHQRTMAEADTLYGISMRDGVSTVLSHRMDS